MIVKVAIIGTVGIPANYGGFETLVENITEHNHSDNLQYSVYCSSKSYKDKRWVYKGAKIIYIPLKANGIQSVIYDAVSIVHATYRADQLLVLGVSGCIILPLIRLFCRKKIIVNIDGLEHRRDKWKKYVRRFLKFSEAIAVKYADTIIADNKGIQDYIQAEYKKDSVLIEYGGDHVLCNIAGKEEKVLAKYNLEKGMYSLALCRIEPENNIEMILAAFAQSGEQIVFVGNWKNSEFGLAMLEKYQKYPNITLLSPIYDVKDLNVLRSNCKFYVHGHSAGGTNPSLVEAMYFGCPIFAYDVVYNRETTENKANYFTNAGQLAEMVSKNICEEYEDNGKSMVNIARRRYTWDKIVEQYEQLFD